jgi:hypothetical protein
MLLLRAGDRLSARALRRLDHVLARDDPTGENGAAAVQRPDVLITSVVDTRRA